VRLVFAAVLASLGLAAPAQAAAPELFVRLQPWDTHEAVSDWIPLASAPTFGYVGGYEIGYRLQVAGFQQAALTVTGVPDGQPTQPSNAEPFCVGRNGAAGTIVAAGPELQFEGNGTYSVKVSVGGADCTTAGESATASFTVAASAVPVLVGEPFSFRATALPGDPFVGVRAEAPPGGYAEISCALDGAVQTDGSVTGSRVIPNRGDFIQPETPEWVFPRPGSWTCVARGTADGQDDAHDDVFFTTPWSAPITFDVRSDFRRRVGAIAKARSKRPRFTFKAEWPDVAAGGRASVTLFRVAGCKGKRYRLRKGATAKGRFGAKNLRLAVKRPRAGYYLGRFSFSGTRFLRRSVDPNPLLLLARHDRLEYVPARDFPGCG
jgi:hypothetical protein